MVGPLVTAGASRAPGGRREALQSQLEEDPPPGMLAYVEGEVAGWVWSIICFLVRVGYRRRGVAAALLDGVVEFARRSGAQGVEAYPIDPEGGRVDVGFGYVGVTPMFEKAGFRRVVETSAHSDGRPRILMRLEF